MKLIEYMNNVNPDAVRVRVVDADPPKLSLGNSPTIACTPPSMLSGILSLTVGGKLYSSSEDGIFIIPAYDIIMSAGNIELDHCPISPLNDVPEIHFKYVSLIIARNCKLKDTDWVVIRHRDQLDEGASTDLTTDQYTELLIYRQSLRDLPENVNLDNIVWPTPPSFL